ncbi:MAG: acyltransferase [Lachnospiraceae bacterium]|nr:acyltransferase [Lachnospiraceae bacterium]
MKIVKIMWALRALIYKPFLKKMGRLTYIGKPIWMSKKKNIEFGNKVRIYPGSRFETVKDGTIRIYDNVSIGQNFHCISEGNLLIGANTTISGNVFVTNMDHDYTEIGKHILEQKHIVKETVIGENCFIGYGAVIQAGTKLGRHCVVGSNAVVRGEYPDYSIIVGVPAKIVKIFDFAQNEWSKYNEK